MLVVCAFCGAECDRRTGEVNRAAKAGRPLYCSRVCGNAGRSSRRKKPSETAWHALRFTERPNTIRKECLECGTPMWMPPSKAQEYKRCSKTCNAALHEKTKEARKRQCAGCGKNFFPRQVQIDAGAGRYCSHACQPVDHLFTDEAIANKNIGYWKARASGALTYPTGPDHHSWKGGKPESQRRLRESGVQAERLRRYRAENPHKVREFTLRRKGKKHGRLEYGSIPRIGRQQGWKCAICRVSIKAGYHVDHIMPLAKGGEHVARNIQLLCQTCNVRKAAKDPIAFMRQLGRLL